MAGGEDVTGDGKACREYALTTVITIFFAALAEGSGARVCVKICGALTEITGPHPGKTLPRSSVPETTAMRYLQTPLTMLLALVLLAPAAAQRTAPPPEDDDEVVRITTELVQVDAVVTDEDGRHVTDLRPEDFEVTEDARPQEVTNFSYIDVSSGAPGRAAPAAARVEKGAAPVPPARVKPGSLRRTVALVVDDLSLSPENTYEVRRGLKKYVEEQLGDHELSAVLRTSSGVAVLQQFTSDKRLLHAAVERLRWSPRSRSGFDGGAIASPLNSLAAGVDGTRNATAEQTLSENSARDTLGSLMYIVRGLQSIPGRKALVLFTAALPMKDESGIISERMRRLADLANRSSVVFYTVDARGLQPLNFSADQPSTMPHLQPAARVGLASVRMGHHEMQDGMSYLPQETGGLFFREQNNFNKGLAEMLEDQKGYYLIGYRPTASTFDPQSGARHFRKLGVRVKRPGLKVRSRKGFFGVAEPAREARPRTEGQKLVEALSSPFGASDVGLHMAALFVNEPGRGAAIRSIIHVAAADLKFTEEAGGRRKATIEVAAVVFTSDGRPTVQGRDSRELSLSEAEYRDALKNGLTYRLNVPVSRPGDYNLRVALRDTATGRLGAVREFISVPDLVKGPLALSGIVLSGVEPSRAGAGAAAVELSGGAGVSAEAADPGLSPAMRRLRHGLFLDYGYAVYNARLERATGRPRLETQVRLFREGRLVFEGGVAPLEVAGQKDMKRLVGGGRLQVGTELVPGDYVLQVVVTDTLAGKKRGAAGRVATQWVDFEVVK